MVWANAQYIGSRVSLRGQQLNIMASASASGAVDSQQQAARLPASSEEIPQASLVDGELTAPPRSVSPEASANVDANASSASASMSTIHSNVQRLKAEQKRLREDKKRVATELRNAEKKRQRLKHRAVKLSDADLLAVIQLRRDEKAARDENANSSTAAPSGELTPQDRRSRSPSCSTSEMTATPVRRRNPRAELTAADGDDTQQR